MTTSRKLTVAMPLRFAGHSFEVGAVVSLDTFARRPDLLARYLSDGILTEVDENARIIPDNGPDQDSQDD